MIGWGIIWKLQTDVPQHCLMFSKVDILPFERSSPTHSFCSTWYYKIHSHSQQNQYDYWPYLTKTTYLFLPGISSTTGLPSYRPIFFVTWKSCDICKYLKNDGIDLTKARQRLWRKCEVCVEGYLTERSWTTLENSGIRKFSKPLFWKLKNSQ